MGRSSDSMGGHGYGAETGRVRGTTGSYYDKYEGLMKNLPDVSRPALPPPECPREAMEVHTDILRKSS